MVAEHREVERKYDIEPGRPLPPLVDAGPTLRVTELVEIDLEAVYLDSSMCNTSSSARGHQPPRAAPID